MALKGNGGSASCCQDGKGSTGQTEALDGKEEEMKKDSKKCEP